MSGSRSARSRAPRWWRARRLAVAVGLLVVASVFVVGWLARSDVDRRGLGTPSRLLVTNLAGPLEVVEGEGPVVVETSASYLVAGPTIETSSDVDGAVVRVSCRDWTPCRVAAKVQVPPGTAVEAVAPDDVVSVGAFTGPLTVSSDDGRVALGPVSGPLDVVVGSAPVQALDVASPVARFRSVSGPVEVVVRVVPEALTIEGGSAPVTVTVPDARYRLDLRGDPLDAPEGSTPRRPDGVITIDSEGPVELELSNHDGT